MKTTFAKDAWNRDDFSVAYSHRFTETPAFTQNEDSISGGVNPDHREGFDNISMLTKDTYGNGSRAEIHCAFEGLGCPEIIIVPEAELCEDGAVRYGACFEAVLWKHGLNIWRHYREDGRCFWHKRLGLSFEVDENAIHTLSVELKDQDMIITVDGKQAELHTEDLPEKFHWGITVCEGIARVYDMAIEGE